MQPHNAHRSRTIAPTKTWRRVAAAALMMTCTAGYAAAQDTDLRSYYSGNGLLSRGQYEPAIDEYTTFLESHPSHEKADVARYGLAVALSRLNRHDEALAALSEIDPNNDFEYAAEAVALAAQSRFTLADYEGAARDFRRLLESHPDSDPAPRCAALLVESLHRAARFDDTELAYQELLRGWAASPLLDRAEFFSALSLMERRQYQDAAARFGNVLERDPAGPLSTQSTLLRAQCQHHANALPEAVAGYRIVIEQIGGELAADALLGLGGALLTLGETQEAAVMLDRFLRDYPEHNEAERAEALRGRAAFDLGDYDEAQARLEELSESSQGSDVETEYWLAKSELRAGDPEQASRRMQRAVRRFGDSSLAPQMRYDLAIAQLRAGQDEAAEETLIDFRANHPGHELDPQALHLLATLSHRRGDYETSDEWCVEFQAGDDHEGLGVDIAFLRAENALLSGDLEEAAGRYVAYLDNHADAENVATAQHRLGDTLFRLERRDEARPYLAAAAAHADDDPSFRSAHRLLGDISFDEQSWDDAAHSYEQFLAYGWDQDAADDAAIRWAISLQRIDEHEQSIALHDRLLDEYPDSPHRLQSIFERGQAYLALDDADEAERAFEQVLEEDPDSRFASFAQNHLGSIALQRNDFAGAASRFEAASRSGAPAEIEATALLQRGQALLADGDYGGALESFDTLLNEHGDSPHAVTAAAQRGVALSRLGRHDEAVDVINEALQDSGGLSTRLRATLIYERAWCQSSLGSPDEAARDYRDLLEGDAPDDLALYAMVDLARIEADAGRHDTAVDLLRRAHEQIDSGVTAPDDLRERATYSLGASLYELGRFGEASTQFQSFIAAHPESDILGSALLLNGESLVQTGRYVDAIEDLQRVVDEFTEDEDLVEPAMLRLGESLASAQRWAQSEEVFTAYLERFADSDLWFQAQFGIGWAQENQQRFNEAVDSYGVVVNRHEGETSARSQFQIGECQFAMRDYDGAIRELLKVDILYAYPEWSAAALYEAGRCFEATLRMDDARAQYTQVVERFADSDWAALAAQRISELPEQASLPGR